MTKSYLLFLIVTFAGISVSLANKSFLPRMAGGQVTQPGQFPAVVSIQVPNQQGHCSGTIIDATHVLTSVRCVITDAHTLLNPLLLNIIAGDLNIVNPNFGRFTTNVTHIYVHAEVNLQTGNNDIAVLRVGNPFPFPHNTIDLAVRGTLAVGENTICQFAGWGSNASDGPVQPIQVFLQIPIIGIQQCNATSILTENMICGGQIINPTPSLCPGNIGGGLMCNGLLAGILTSGNHCGLPPFTPSFYTQVRNYEAWIQQQILRTDNPQPGTPVGIPGTVPI